MPPPTRRRRKKIKPSYSSRRPTLSAAFRNSTVLETAFLAGLVIVAAIVLWTYQFISTRFDNKGGAPEISLQQALQPQQPAHNSGHLRGNYASNNNMQQISTVGAGGYAHYSKIAQDLAALTPAETLEKLEREDPFGTRTFDSQLLQQETELGRVLTIDEIKQVFPCPIRNEDRI